MAAAEADVVAEEAGRRVCSGVQQPRRDKRKGMNACMHVGLLACTSMHDVSVYVCMFVNMYFICLPFRLSMCMSVCMHTCMHACMYVCIYVCMYVCMYACMYMYVCMYVCIYV